MDGARVKLPGSPPRNTPSAQGRRFQYNTSKSFKLKDGDELFGRNGHGNLDFDVGEKPSRIPSPSVSSMRFSFGESSLSPRIGRGTNGDDDVNPKKRDSLDDLFLPTQSLATQAESISLAPVIVDLDNEEFIDAATFIKRTETPVRASTKPVSPVRKASFDVDFIESPQEFFARRSRNLKSVEFGTGDEPPSTQADDLKQISLELNKAISSSAVPPSTTAPSRSPRLESPTRRSFYKLERRGVASPRESTAKRSELYAKDVADSQRGRSTGSFPSFQAEHGIRTGSGNLPIHDPKPFSKLDLSISQDISNSLAPSVGFARSDVPKQRNPHGLTVETNAVVDYAKPTPLPPSIKVDLNHDSAKAVADAIQAASAMPTSERANMNWTNPIHPSQVIHHSLDAVVAVQAMMEATNVMQNSVSEVLRLRALAQKAVEAAVVSEAMAIADYCRTDGSRGEMKALAPNAVEYSAPKQNHDASPRLPIDQQFLGQISGGARNEFSTSRTQSHEQRHRSSFVTRDPPTPTPATNRIPSGDNPAQATRANPATAEDHAKSYKNSTIDRQTQDDPRGQYDERTGQGRFGSTDLNRDAASWQYSTNNSLSGPSPRRNQRPLSHKTAGDYPAQSASPNEEHNQSSQRHQNGEFAAAPGPERDMGRVRDGEYDRQQRRTTPTNDLPPRTTRHDKTASRPTPTEATRAANQHHRDGFDTTGAMHAEELGIPSADTPTSLRSQRLVAQDLPTARRADSVFHREDPYYTQSSPRTLDRPKLCKRFLCTIGGEISETFVFRNTSSKYARICASIVPLSRGCNQFVITPTVLEMAPNSSDHFVIRFIAARIGAVSAIFQFRSMSGDPLATPYEIIVDAHVKKAAAAASVDLPPRPAIAEDAHQQQQPLHVFDVQPTHLQLAGGASATFDIFNFVTTSSSFSVNCPFDHIQVTPNQGVIHPNGKCSVRVSLAGSSHVKPWCGLLAVVVNGSLTREVSVVVDPTGPRVDMASSIKEMAMSYSTESTSTTTRSKSRKKGLFFQAKCLDFGPRGLQSPHCLPVRICNGGKEPITVFLQPMSAPFTCSYSSVSLRPRSYVEVPVYFTPTVPGQVTASMVAFSAVDKATLTLQGHGVE